MPIKDLTIECTVPSLFNTAQMNHHWPLCNLSGGCTYMYTHEHGSAFGQAYHLRTSWVRACHKSESILPAKAS